MCERRRHAEDIRVRGQRERKCDEGVQNELTLEEETNVPSGPLLLERRFSYWPKNLGRAFWTNLRRSAA